MPLCREFFLEFSSKNAGFYAFVLRKTTCGQKLGLGRGLIRPPGAEDVKRTGVENLAGGSTPPNPLSTCTMVADIICDGHYLLYIPLCTAFSGLYVY